MEAGWHAVRAKPANTDTSEVLLDKKSWHGLSRAPARHSQPRGLRTHRPGTGTWQQHRSSSSCKWQCHLQQVTCSIFCRISSTVCLLVSSAARRSHSSEMKPPRASITAARGQRGSSTQSCPPALFLGCSCSSRCPPSPSPGPVHLGGPPQPSPCPCGSGESSSLGCARPPGRICFLAFSFQDYGGDLYTCL